MHFTSYTTKSIKQIFSKLQTSENGLNNGKVRERQVKFGKNEIKTHEVKWWQILCRQFKSPFIYLLIFAAVLAFLLQDEINGIMIFIFVALTSGLSFLQEYHSEKALKLLKKFIVSRAKVIRNSKEILIDSRDLVCGDIVIVETGDIIPADIRFFQEENLSVDEEVLTGESVPIKKISTELKTEIKEIHLAQNIGFSGTKISSGFGKGIVIAIGHKTMIGEVAKLTTETKRISTFEKEITKFSRFILRMILITLIFVFLANLFIKGRDANLVELIIFAIALAVSVVPEALPVVTTVSLSRGALQLAKNKAVTKRLSAIEDLGSIDILCTDKTGTLTENNLTVSEVNSADRNTCLFYAILASSFLGERKREPNNAFDLALCKCLSEKEKNEIDKYQRLDEMPFNPEKRYNIVLAKKDTLKLIVRGAPEAVLNFCAMGVDEKRNLLNWAAKEGKSGKRVIAIIKKEMTESPKNFEEELNNLSFLGLIAFVDPIKKSVKEAVNKAKSLGVKIKILTGDSREVSGAVAHQMGLIENQKEVLTGEELDKMPDYKQHQAVNNINVFARVSPAQKYKIIKLLEEKNEVGFLGEGINDAPALKIANVAIVVDSAADIAREAADIVLLKKSLFVIIAAIRDGRQIFANTVKYIKITLVSNFGNFYAIALASLMVSFLPMLPLQILLVNLLSDFPMIAIAVDLVDEKELQKPKNYNIKEVILISVVLGLVSTIFDFIFFALYFKRGSEILQTNWFIASILTELVLIFSLRTKSIFFKAKRPAFLLSGLSIIAFLATIIIPFLAFGQNIFKFIKPTYNDLWIILTIVLVYFICTETVKLVYYRIFNRKGGQSNREQPQNKGILQSMQHRFQNGSF